MSAPSSAPPSTATPDASPPSEPGPSVPLAAESPAEVVEPLPDVSVEDVAAGTQVHLASLLPAEQPILLWICAPH